MSSVRNYVLLLCALSSAANSLYTLPITKHAGSGIRRRQNTGAIGIGDFDDEIYSVKVTIGSDTLPLLLDTGSADLWSISTDCTLCGAPFDTPQISASSLQPTGMGIEIDYGDTFEDATFASGTVVSGPVSIAGIQLKDQFLAAVNNTNNPLVERSISGILGAGFPLNSNIFGTLIEGTLLNSNKSPTDIFISSLQTQGPMFSRLAKSGQLEQPMFTITLERETFRVGGNVGQLTIGQLPDGVSNNSLTWVPVRVYTQAQGGIPGPTDAPHEIYPMVVLRSGWEIFIDSVTLNGETLPRPPINASLGYSALIDTGTSAILGPENVVTSIYSSISGQPASTTPLFSCREPINLAYTIGGKQFPVDPRDIVNFDGDDGVECDASNIFTTAPPSVGFLSSWILGVPFLKSNLVAFYFGNLTHPSMDPPRIGILSTVPSNAGDLYIEALNAAQAGDFLDVTSIAAPTGTFGAASTNSAGVKQASTSALEPTTTQPNGIPVGPFPSNDAPGMRPSFLLTISAIVASVWIL